MSYKRYTIAKILLPLLFVVIISDASRAQKGSSGRNETEQILKQPALVVGIVVDQMRYDYLWRYYDKYGMDGFRRLMREGFLCKDANFDYVPTYTAPGHACIFTGTGPAVNGIISNEWYDRVSGKDVYCVNDTTVKPVGTTSISGKMSPRNLLSGTITDELRIASKFHSRVIGIALKDRGSVLPAGHTANAAYWHDPYTNNWVSSTYYMEQLPEWVQAFNRRKVIDSLLNFPWNTLLPIESYTESTADDNRYEGLYKGETRPVFPHDLPKLKASEPELIRKTPFGNTFTRMFAEEAVRSEQLGKGSYTDFLTVSFSSTDYIGHMYGIDAIETEDTYLRLDRELAHLLSFLDAYEGKGNYLLFLTADHGAARNTLYAGDIHMPSGLYSGGDQSESLHSYIKSLYKDSLLILSVTPHTIYLNNPRIEKAGLRPQDVAGKCRDYVLGFEGVSEAVTARDLLTRDYSTGIKHLIQNGFNYQRSADVLVQLKPGWINWFTGTGTTHGSTYSYDTHVPLLFFGNGVRSGSSLKPVAIKDIAPTIAVFLNLEYPSGCTGKPIPDVFK